MNVTRFVSSYLLSAAHKAYDALGGTTKRLGELNTIRPLMHEYAWHSKAAYGDADANERLKGEGWARDEELRRSLRIAARGSQMRQIC
jgi:hypothetical protein